MKKNIYFLVGMFSFGALCTGCSDDDNTGKAVNITVNNATNIESDIFGIDVTEGQPLQLKPFIMPESARENAVSYHFAGEPTGAIELSESGLITPKLTHLPKGISRFHWVRIRLSSGWTTVRVHTSDIRSGLLVM